MIPAIARGKLADAVDAFCETIAFSPEQTARVFVAAQAAGLPVKLHADQLSNLHGARLAAEHGALSADHREIIDLVYYHEKTVSEVDYPLEVVGPGAGALNSSSVSPTGVVDRLYLVGGGDPTLATDEYRALV